MVYDAENRMISTAGTLGSATYTYDGDGKRVAKSNGKLYWYPSASLGAGGMSSDPLFETDAAGNVTDEYIFFAGKRTARKKSTGEINYYFADHLGSSRVVTSAAGAILDDSDFYPFGKEVPFLASSDNNYLFTGKERDTESGLDNFGARFDSSSLGRFLSPDPLMASARISNPQTWNRYSYVLNNPLRFVDPDGLEEKCTDTEKCTVRVKVNVVHDKNANNGKGLTDKQKEKFQKDLLAKAQKEFGKSKIELEVTYTQGSLEVTQQGVSITGAQAGAINVVVTDRLPADLAPTGQEGVAGKAGGLYAIGVGIDDAGKGVLAHELGHQFLGHPDRQFSRDAFTAALQYYAGEASVDVRRLGQAMGIRQDAFREGAKKFSVPPDQKSIQPRKDQ
jgi:RHS repeat-associated protein